MANAAPARRPARDVFPLWGGYASVVAADRSMLGRAVAQVKRTVEAFDLACSGFREDSELAMLNASAGPSPIVVSSLLLTAVREAVRAGRETAGAVDPTVGRALIAHGFCPNLGASRRPRAPEI